MISPWHWKHEPAADELARLDRQIFGDAADSLQSWQQEKDNGAAKIILALRDEQPVAFISVLAAGDDIEIRKIGVVPEWRRRGVAQNLFRQALAAIPAHRCLIDVSSANGGAIAFYRKMNFHEITRRKRYYSDGSDAIVMALTLAPDPNTNGV